MRHMRVFTALQCLTNWLAPYCHCYYPIITVRGACFLRPWQWDTLTPDQSQFIQLQNCKAGLSRLISKTVTHKRLINTSCQSIAVKCFASHSKVDAHLTTSRPRTRQSCRTMHMGPVCHCTVCLFTPPTYAVVPNYTAWRQKQMCTNNLSKVALDSEAAATEPVTCNHNHNSLTTAPLNHVQSTNKQISKSSKCIHKFYMHMHYHRQKILNNRYK